MIEQFERIAAAENKAAGGGLFLRSKKTHKVIILLTVAQWRLIAMPEQQTSAAVFAVGGTRGLLTGGVGRSSASPGLLYLRRCERVDLGNRGRCRRFATLVLLIGALMMRANGNAGGGAALGFDRGDAAGRTTKNAFFGVQNGFCIDFESRLEAASGAIRRYQRGMFALRLADLRERRQGRFTVPPEVAGRRCGGRRIRGCVWRRAQAKGRFWWVSRWATACCPFW